MKNYLMKLLCIFAFILCSALNVFAAADLNITSVSFDNASSFITINSFDNDDYQFSVQPKLYIVEDEKKAYFDINSAVLRCSAQDLVITSSGIKEVIVKQFSANPNVVRVVIYYNDTFNPNNIRLKRLNNTLFVTFSQPGMQNYYFQHIYSDAISSVKRLYESVIIQSPVVSSDNNVLNQINSAFKLGSTTEDKNYILTKKDLILPTSYYLDNLNIKNNAIHFTGAGSISLSKPIYLTNPTRVAYDLPNATVNSAIRNKEVNFTQTETIKVGQFDKDTVRIVITSKNADRYIPVIYGDAQRLAFIDKTSTNYNSLFSTKSSLTAVNDEIVDSVTHSMKLIFSKPVVYGIERVNSGFDLYLYNVEKDSDINMKSSTIFDNVKITSLKNGGIKVTIPAAKDDIIDLHTGADAKTVRIRHKLNDIQLPTPDIQPVVNVEPIVIPKPSDKKFIVIDPGHGGSDCGATRNNIYEKNITLDVSKRVAELLKKKGYAVYMTRETDETVSLQERVEISENISPDVFVSIHVNSSNSDSPNGLETHYYKDNSLQLAKTVHASMLNHIKAANRGLFKSKFYVINHTTAPAILVEIGFISNSAERAQLVSESRKQATAKAIAEGIDEYFK